MESLSTPTGRLLPAALALLAAAFGSACFDSPRPNCAFTCVTSGTCPEGYTCGGDGRCHLMTATGPAVCDDGVPPIFDADVDVDSGPPADAGPDATPGEPDAAPPVTDHNGTISITDTSLQGHPELGHGLQLTVDLTALDPVETVVDTMPGSPLGCKVRVYDVTMGQFPPVTDMDHGDVTITGAARPIPVCKFVPMRGYLCQAGGGAAGAGDMIVKNPPGAPAGTAAWVDVPPAAHTFTSDDVGRYLSVSGVGGGNDGAFPIVAVDTATNTAIYGNPIAASDATLTGGGFAVVAGLGPVPGAPPPEPLADGDTLSVGIDALSGEFDFPDINLGVGDAFALDSASQAALTDFPLDGMPLELKCDPSSCAAGSALGSIVVIQTTDGVVGPGVPDYVMPTPASKIVVARCAAFDTKISIPASVMQQIQMAGASRIRTTYLRVNFNPTQNPDGTNPVNIVAGHAIAGFTTDVSCVTPADCGADTECLTRTCVGNVCGASFTPDGTALAMQTAGDCRTLQCDGMGGIEPIENAADLPVDGLDCTNDVCNGLTPSNPPVMMGMSCDDDGGSVCNGGGLCVDCNVPDDCPGMDTECQMRTCSMNACGVNNVADDTPLAMQTAGDCKQEQCNGAGGEETVALASDLPVDANQCTDNVCTGQTPSNPNSDPGTACTQSGGQVCDGMGACVECISGLQCMDPEPVCDTTTNQCVECVDAGDCQKGEVCTSNTCQSAG